MKWLLAPFRLQQWMELPANWSPRWSGREHNQYDDFPPVWNHQSVDPVQSRFNWPLYEEVIRQRMELGIESKHTDAIRRSGIFFS